MLRDLALVLKDHRVGADLRVCPVNFCPAEDITG